jgi:hypothetical protein
MVNKDKYILEIETSSCILISAYNKNKSGFKKALMKAQAEMQVKEIISAKIFCLNSKEVAWSLGKQIN